LYTAHLYPAEIAASINLCTWLAEIVVADS
jgi:hypothetical protein